MLEEFKLISVVQRRREGTKSVSTNSLGEDMSYSTISSTDVTCSEDPRIKTSGVSTEQIIMKVEKLPTLPTVTSNDDERSLQFTPKLSHDGTFADKFFDAVVQLESNDNSFTNFSAHYDSTKRENPKTKRSLFLCCFCPAASDTLDDSDHGDDYGYNNILDFAGCNMDTSDIDFGVDDDGDDDNLISFDCDERPSFDCTSTICQDEFISCCDTKEFDFECNYEDSLSFADTEPSEPIELFSRHIRICNLNVHECTSIESEPSEKEAETTMDTSTSSTTLKNDGVGDDESIEAILTSPEPTKVGIQGSKLTFLELTNRYDGNSQDHIYHSTVIKAMNSMTQLGLDIALGNKNQKGSISVSWKEEGSTYKLLNKIRSSGDTKWYSNPDLISLLEKDTLVWSGSSMVTEGMDQLVYGSKIPYFKARGIIPHISPLDLVELILDSSRVKVYNKWTNGRDDLHVFQAPLHKVNGLYGDGCLKVVESKTAIPFSSNTLKMVNFLHARPLKLEHDDLCEDDGIEINCSDTPNAYIIVSRSIYTEEDVSEDENSNITQATPGSKNEIIMGVNIFREVPGHPDKTDMLTISQANSSAIPGFLAHKAGMMGATDFFKSLRGIQMEDL